MKKIKINYNIKKVKVIVVCFSVISLFFIGFTWIFMNEGKENDELNDHQSIEFPITSDLQPIPHGEYRELALQYLPIMYIDPDCEYYPSIVDPNDDGNSDNDRDDYRDGSPGTDTTYTTYIEIEVKDKLKITYWFYYVYNESQKLK